MSKKLYLLLLSFVFLSRNLNVNAMAADRDLEDDYLLVEKVEPKGKEPKISIERAKQDNPNPVLNLFSLQNNPGFAVKNISGEIQKATQEMMDRIMSKIQNLKNLNALLKKYNGDLSLVKDDPKFSEIKPDLKEAYETISSLPFLLSIGRGGIDMFKASIQENMAKEAGIKGFEELDEDVQQLMDNTFSYVDKFIEFLRKFSKHFVENKTIKELLAD